MKLIPAVLSSVAVGAVAAGSLAVAIPAMAETAPPAAPVFELVEQGADGAGEMERDRGGRGAHLRETLQELVDNDTLTADQADAVASHLEANRPEREGHRDGGRHNGERHGGIDPLNIAATTLNVTEDELRQAHRDGLSLAEFIESTGGDVDQARTDLIAAGEEAIADAAVENDWDDSRTEKMNERVTEHVDAMLAGEKPGGKHGKGRG